MFLNTGLRKIGRGPALFCMVLAVLVSLCFSGYAQAASNERYASIVIDAQTGAVLHERHADKRLYPASLVKMMTMYMVFDALSSGKINRNTRWTVSPHAAQQEPSRLGLKPGSTIRVDDAVRALATKSANDVAVVVAEGLGGNEKNFARMMNAKAQALGMTRTRFMNASGLPHPDQVSTARDMATLSRALVYNHPRYYSYFSVGEFSYAGKKYRNHNRLMETYYGMDGIKTGYTSRSGFNLAASAVRDGRRVIGVVFGGRTTKSRNDHMKALLDMSFAKIGKGHTRIASAAALPARKPAFNAMGLVMNGAAGGMVEQGDAALEQVAVAAVAPAAGSGFQPRALNTTKILGTLPPAGDAALDTGWVVQVGAFSSHDAGVRALQAAKSRLPEYVAQDVSFRIVPLQTNKGVIYRARMTGFENDGAAGSACTILRGNCLVLSAQ